MVLDVLIRYLPSTMYSTVGRSFFTPTDARPLPNGAEVWQGYYQSARPTVGKKKKKKKNRVQEKIEC
jgi:hypothetical protein